MNPISIYGQTKLEAEKIVCSKEGFVGFRLATVFGASSRMRTDLLVNNLVLKAIQDKVLVLYESQFMRNYVHIKDICRAFRFATDNWNNCKNEIYNVGNDSLNCSKMDLVRTINKHISVEIIKAAYAVDPDSRNYIVSSQKFYNKGFACKYTLEDGIEDLMQAYSMIDNPVFANY